VRRARRGGDLADRQLVVPDDDPEVVGAEQREAGLREHLERLHEGGRLVDGDDRVD